MLKCGAHHVRVRLRTKWSINAERTLNILHGKDVFKSDIDVVARFSGIYYVISCKAGKNVRPKKTVAEVQAVATLFGRFAIPLFARLKYSGKPYEIDKTYVFGPETFTDIKAMKALLLEAASKQKTGEV